MIPTYEFAGLRFSPVHSILENTATRKKIKLTQTYCHFLLALVEKSPDVAEYNEIRRKVWVQYAEMSESLKHLIQETKRGLVKILKHEGFPFNFIEPVAGKGYVVKTLVKIISETKGFAAAEKSLSDSLSVTGLNESGSKFIKEKSYVAYKLAASAFYGLLFWLGLLLETAYQFDRFGATAIWLGLPLTAWNGTVMFLALSSAEKSFFKNYRPKFWLGACLLISGAILSCLAMFFFLPFEAITAARFQTQPAFAAFLKNALIYFLPLGIFYVFTPLYLTRQNLNKKFSNVLPNLFGLLFLVLIYSLFSTFYLLDNLLTSPFHGLFVTLVFLRFIVYFGLGAACLLWAKAKSGADSSPAFFRQHSQTVFFFGLLAIALSLITIANLNYKIPNLSGVEMKSLPDAERQMFVNLYGAHFDAKTICVRVIGEDCEETTPCLVPNGALKKHSVITENRLENVPLTLPSGEFRIFAENGDSPMSNAVVLNVP